MIQLARTSDMADGDMAGIHLEGAHGVLDTTVGAWGEFLQLACDHGWNSENPPSYYQLGVPLHVSADDANRLADALQNALRKIVKLTRSDRTDIQALVSDVLDLITFCRDGCFKIHADRRVRRVVTDCSGPALAEDDFE